MEKLKPINNPTTIDVSMTGACQLDCAWCWGEEHSVKTVHNEDEWKELLEQFSSNGTSGVVFTGGEPLVSSQLPNVLRYAKETLGLRTTLSTNSILLEKLHSEVLPWVDDLGISLDGSSPEMHKEMRAGKIDNFPHILNALRLVQDEYPDIDLTVRTVIARKNINDVQLIPQILDDNGIDISRIRFKLYQVEPIGPRSDIIDSDEWRVSEDESLQVEQNIKRLYPGLNLNLQLYGGTSGRYYQIGPRGNAYGTYIDDVGAPQMVPLGNPIDNFDQAMNLLTMKYPYSSTH